MGSKCCTAQIIDKGDLDISHYPPKEIAVMNRFSEYFDIK